MTKELQVKLDCVEVKDFLGIKDNNLSIQLRPDVNMLIGCIGSGKNTLINLMYSLLSFIKKDIYNTSFVNKILEKETSDIQSKLKEKYCDLFDTLIIKLTNNNILKRYSNKYKEVTNKPNFLVKIKVFIFLKLIVSILMLYH